MSLNWWEANQFRMPSTPRAQRYMPSLLDYPSLSASQTDGGGSHDTGNPFTAGGGKDALDLPGQQYASLERSGSGPSHRSIGSVLGTLAGFALPGAGLLGSAMGTVSDVDRANKDLEAIGAAPSMKAGDAIAGEALFGLGETAGLGKGMNTQANEALGFNQGMTGLNALANVAKGLDTSHFGFDIDPVTGRLGASSAAGGSGMGGISPGAGGPMSTLSDGTVAGYGALGTPSGGGQAPSAPDGGGYGSMSGDAGDPGANGGPSGPWNRGGVLPRRQDRVSGPDDQVITAKSGEGIIRTEAVEHYGPGLIGAINRMKIPKKELQGLLGVRA